MSLVHLLLALAIILLGIFLVATVGHWIVWVAMIAAGLAVVVDATDNNRTLR